MSTKLNPKDLSDAAIEMIAARFKVLSDPTRLKLLIALEAGEKNVTELVEAVGRTQANVSRHLQTLLDAGIVTRRKEGVNVYYGMDDHAVFGMCQHVCASLQRRLEAQAEAAKLFKS